MTRAADVDIISIISFLLDILLTWTASVAHLFATSAAIALAIEA